MHRIRLGETGRKKRKGKGVANLKISTKGRYALRLMIDVAINSSEKPVSIKDIAKRQDISDKYLEQIISVLTKADFLRSIRGAQGGYVLRKSPAEYTVGMILRLTEGSLAPVACVEENAPRCERMDNCATVEVWRRMHDAINGVVDHITLADLLKWQKNIEEKNKNPIDILGNKW